MIPGDADAGHTNMKIEEKLMLMTDIHPIAKNEFLNIIQSQWGQASPTEMIEWPTRPELYHPTERR